MIFPRKLDKNSPIPLYYQIKEALQEMIDNSELSPGNPVPSERDLCERFAISRMTAGKAVTALVNEGILYRERGRGTFVAHPKSACTSSHLAGFSDNIRAAGLASRTKILLFEREEASRTIREALEIGSGEGTVFNILRLRFVEDEPFSGERGTDRRLHHQAPPHPEGRRRRGGGGDQGARRDGTRPPECEGDADRHRHQGGAARGRHETPSEETVRRADASPRAGSPPIGASDPENRRFGAAKGGGTETPLGTQELRRGRSGGTPAKSLIATEREEEMP